MFSLTTIVVAYIVSYVAFNAFIGISIAYNGKLSQIQTEMKDAMIDVMNYRISVIDYIFEAISLKTEPRNVKLFWKVSKLLGVIYLVGDIVFYIPNTILWVCSIPWIHFQRYVWKKKIGYEFTF